MPVGSNSEEGKQRIRGAAHVTPRAARVWSSRARRSLLRARARAERLHVLASLLEPTALLPPQVRIVREKATSQIYAMKKLKKSEMLRRGQVDHVKARTFPRGPPD